MIELIFVRHGQTDWNLEGKLQGILDIPLNQTGLEEAIITSQNISRDFNSIISSPLTRALKTAQIINSSLNLEIKTDKRLMERDFGNLSGEKASFVKSMEENNKNEFNVESIENFRDKILDFIKEASFFEEGSYLIVTHGGVIITLLNYLSNGELNWENTPIKNCYLTSLVYNGEWKINYFNEKNLKKVYC